MKDSIRSSNDRRKEIQKTNGVEDLLLSRREMNRKKIKEMQTYETEINDLKLSKNVKN